MRQDIRSLPILCAKHIFCRYRPAFLFWQNIKAKGGIWLEGGKLITATHIIALFGFKSQAIFLLQ